MSSSKIGESVANSKQTILYFGQSETSPYYIYEPHRYRPARAVSPVVVWHILRLLTGKRNATIEVIIPKIYKAELHASCA